ncbi:MAG TPA: LecA/PA-IL family lectin, partial [Symbiobacteriaceae bacterium]|nr:LecA/PA-IL family lectin [Symbiobacteriaceae bacterium]
MVLTWALIAAWLPVAPALADSVPTVGNAAGSVTADAGGAPVVISPNITLSNFTTIDGATVTINGGFVASEDVLAFTSQGGLSGSYNAGNGVLSLSGSASAATYEAVLRSVTYQNTNAATQNTVPRGITFSVGSGALYYQSTGHYYEFVPAPAITWTSARDTAAARSLYGLHGYLATITSNGENTFVAAKVQGLGWIGASDAAQEGVWRWVTGPEAGTQFSGQFKTGWCSAYTGNSVNGQYNHWAGGEPNDCGYNEDYGHYYTDGSWNDYPNYADSIAGYVVEYGGMPGDSAPVLQASTTVLIAPDATGPSVSASLAGPQGQNNWYTGPVLVQMNATDDKSGVASIQYSVDGGPTQTTPGAMAVVPVAADGEHTVTYGATDNAGNPSSTNQPYTVNSLLDSWQDTGIDVSAGATLHITATGSISWDYRRPEAGTTPNGAPSFPYGGFVPNLTFASLVARIGTGQPFMAGANYQGSSATSGRLYLGFNDCAGCFWDNTGSWAVTVVQQQAVSFKVDSTLPTITGSASTTGWSNQPVTVTFTCTDATSGVASCQAPMTVATEGAGQSVTGSAADNAGHSATATVGSINVDLTPPTITGALDHAANAAGWYNGQVSVHFTCADAASGVAACSPDVFLNQEGLGQSATGQATDNVGLTSTTTVSGIKIDLTPPATTASAPSGWQKTPATVTFSATDNLSGVAGTYASVNGGGAQAANSVTLSTDGVHTISYYSMDNAGNAEGGATTTQRQMPANAAWYDTGIDVASGSALNISASGLANYGGGNLVNPNGYNWGVNNWLVPNAYALALVGKIGAGPGFNVGASYSSVAATGGRLYLAMNDCVGCFYDNSGFWSVSVTTNNTVTVKVDQTAPTITGSASTTAWTNQPVTVTFTCADATSGVASCQNPMTVSTAGANQAVTGNATDNAGNNASVTVSGINVDLSAPLTTIAAPTTWQNQDVAVTFTATDNLSGVAATYYTVDGGAPQSGTSFTLTGEGTHTVSFWSVDAAGNAETAHTATVLIDKTAPSISGSTDRAANAAGWYNAAVTVTFTCADSGSGLATCAAPVTLGAAGANQSATGSATD